MNRAPVTLLMLLVAVFPMPGCSGCDGGEVGTLAPNFSIADEVSFGSVLVGTGEVRTIDIANIGNGRGTVQVETPATPFLRLSPSVVDVAPGATAQVSVQARPTAVGGFSADLVLTTEFGPHRIRLSGEAIAVPDCDDDNPCTTEVFDVVTRACDFRTRDGGCDDDNACSENDRCLVGVCIGDPVVCIDDVDCTVDGCHPAVGCTFVASDDLCDDGDRCTDDVCDRDQGCSAAPSPEGARCDDGIACEIANICLQGVCTAVPIPAGVTCDDGNPCTGASHCEAGNCVADEGVLGTAHTVTTRRSFLPASWVQQGNILGERNQAAFVGDLLYVIAKNALTVVDVWSHGFEVIQRLPADADAVVKLDDSTIMTFTRSGSVSVLDLEVPADPVLVRTLELSSNPTAVFVSDNASVGFCLGGNGSNTSSDWAYLGDPRLTGNVIWATVGACQDPIGIVGMGDTLVSSRFSSAGNTRTVFHFSGEPLLEVVDVSSEGSSLFDAGFRIGNLAVFQERDFAATSALTLVDDTTLAVARVDLPVDVRQVLGAYGNHLYVVNEANELVTMQVGGVLTVPFLPFALPPHERTSILAVSDDKMLLREETFEEEAFSRSLWTLDLSEAGEVLGKGADGFSTSVSSFVLGADQSLTVFGVGSVTRGDVASLRSAPVNPLSRRSPASVAAEPILAFDEGDFVGASVLHPRPRTGLCSQCDFGLQWLHLRLATTEFSSGGDGIRQSLPINGIENETPYLERASARGTRLAAYDRNENSILYLDLRPATGSGLPQEINAYTPASSPNFDASHLEVHPDDLVTFVHGQVATLVNFGTTPSSVIAVDADLPRGGVSIGGNYGFLSAFASPEYWMTLMSGGASTSNTAVNPTLTVIARDPDVVGQTEPPVRVELPSNTEALQSQAGYRARILGVEDGLLYISHMRIQGNDHLSEVLVYVLDAFPAGPQEVIALSTEAVGMAVLPDGGRLIAREDGFTFAYPECTED